jgi:uncharacterized protein YjeT (DUF2065 family)
MPPAMLGQTAFSPIATLLRDRRFGLFLIGALLLNIAGMVLHFPAWECAFFRLTGVPCPGCGLTRACMLFLEGKVQAAVKFHAFAPIFIALIAMMITCTLLPKTVTESFVNRAEALERRTGITIIILGGLILYWLARLLLFPTAFAQLIRG